jgi:hypothetical protein
LRNSLESFRPESLTCDSWRMWLCSMCSAGVRTWERECIMLV